MFPISKYISKITDKVANDGFGETAVHVCRAGAQRTVALPVLFRRRYDIKYSLPKRIGKIKAALTLDKDHFYQEVKKSTLNYIKSNHRPDINIGAYAYKAGGAPVLYASCYAALTMHLYGTLDQLSNAERKAWIDYIQSFQKSDGIFRDSVIDIPLAEEIDWWGWRHLTLHVLMALSALGAVAEKPIKIIAPFKKKGFVQDWLFSRNWQNDPAAVSNEVQNYATMLQYARDFQEERWCVDVLVGIYDWLDKTQDSETGLWGSLFNSPILLSNGVQTGYHLWLLYFYDRRPIQYIDRIIDSCLKTQNSYGGFGVQFNSSACEDIDSIDPLMRLSLITDYRKDDILAALQKAIPWILVHMNSDGGWVFRRYEAFQYVPEHVCENEESSMFPTWF